MTYKLEFLILMESLSVLDCMRLYLWERRIFSVSRSGMERSGLTDIGEGRQLRCERMCLTSAVEFSETKIGRERV